MSTTKHRDAWVGEKARDPRAMEQASQASRAAVEQLRAAAAKMIEMTKEIGTASSLPAFYDAVERSAELSRTIAYMSHNLKMFCDFGLPPATVFNDHYINQFFIMSAMKRTWWVEGPAICGFGIKTGSRILEIGCGTGYYTELFFAPFASEVVAFDIDARAIEIAKRYHQAKNIRYEALDSRQVLPAGPFDVAIWSPSIIGYTSDEADGFLQKLRLGLSKNAMLCGWSAVETEKPSEEVPWHDLTSLGARLKKHFANVRVFERNHITIQPPRNCLYFYASDGPIPFDAEWPHHLRL